MALKVINAVDEYDHIFMVEQSICQKQIANASDNPRYSLSLIWRYYKQLEDGSIVFSPNTASTYYDDDFYLTAIQKYAGGDTTDVNTLGAQQLSVKAIVESETNMSLEVV